MITPSKIIPKLREATDTLDMKKILGDQFSEKLIALGEIDTLNQDLKDMVSKCNNIITTRYYYHYYHY